MQNRDMEEEFERFVWDCLAHNPRSASLDHMLESLSKRPNLLKFLAEKGTPLDFDENLLEVKGPLDTIIITEEGAYGFDPSFSSVVKSLLPYLNIQNNIISANRNYLYHGTSVDRLTGILNEGLVPSLLRSNHPSTPTVYLSPEADMALSSGIVKAEAEGGRYGVLIVLNRKKMKEIGLKVKFNDTYGNSVSLRRAREPSPVIGCHQVIPVNAIDQVWFDRAYALENGQLREPVRPIIDALKERGILAFVLPQWRYGYGYGGPIDMYIARYSVGLPWRHKA